MVDEVVADEKKLRNERELTRSNPEKLLEVLMKLFPTWKWQALVNPEPETRTHFVHDSPLHSEFSGDILIDEKLLPLIVYHSVVLYMSLPGENYLGIPGEDVDWTKFPRLYYNLEGVERLLVVYRAWARSHSSDSEYERINTLVASCFV